MGLHSIWTRAALDIPVHHARRRNPKAECEDENKNDDDSINVESGHWGLPRPRRVLRCLELSSPNHETSVLSIGDTCWAHKRLFRRRIAALDCRPAFQGRYLGDPRKESAPRQRRSGDWTFK